MLTVIQRTRCIRTKVPILEVYQVLAWLLIPLLLFNVMKSRFEAKFVRAMKNRRKIAVFGAQRSAGVITVRSSRIERSVVRISRVYCYM